MPDDFRDPVGVLVSTRLGLLAEQLRGPMQEDVVRAAVDELMQLQAVWAPDADAAARTVLVPLQAAVGPIFRAARDEESRAEALLHEAGAGALLHEAEATDEGLAARLDVLRALAVESFGRNRARIAGIRERELERSRFVERRARERGDAWKARLETANRAGGA